MKAFIKLIFIIVFSLYSSNSYAYENEPENFRNFIWGETIESVRTKYPSLKYATKVYDTDVYSITIDNPYLCGVPLYDTAFIYFSNNKLSQIELTVPIDYPNDLGYKELKLLQNLVKLYGKANTRAEKGSPNTKQGYDTSYIWIGEKSTHIIVFMHLRRPHSSAYETYSGEYNLSIKLASADIAEQEGKMKKAASGGLSNPKNNGF